MRRLVLASCLLAAPCGAQAAMPCHAYKDLAEVLGRKYQENPVSLGVQTNGHVLQVFASAQSGSWTMLSVAPSGKACVLAAGKHWEQVEKAAGDAGA